MITVPGMRENTNVIHVSTKQFSITERVKWCHCDKNAYMYTILSQPAYESSADVAVYLTHMSCVYPDTRRVFTVITHSAHGALKAWWTAPVCMHWRDRASGSPARFTNIQMLLKLCYNNKFHACVRMLYEFVPSRVNIAAVRYLLNGVKFWESTARINCIKR